MLKKFNFYRLVSLSPWVYILAYVIVIVSFALLYNSVAREFYHPYAKYERPMGKIATQVRDGLTASFRDALTKHPALHETVHVDPDRVIVPTVKPEGSHLLISVRLEIVNLEKGKGWQAMLAMPIKINTQAVLYTKTPEDVETFSLFPQLDPQWEGGYFKALAAVYEDSAALRKNVEEAVRTIQVSHEDIDRMRALTAGYAGFPSNVPGGLFRMLYLSLVTVTTLGYGDIVPITDRTRWLTGIEATLGIILLGLFISSLVSTGVKRSGSER